MNVIGRVSDSLHTAKTLLETGILRPSRPDKMLRVGVALRHRAKNEATIKRRRSAVARQHESNSTDFWKQNQTNWFGQPRGLATSF